MNDVGACCINLQSTSSGAASRLSILENPQRPYKRDLSTLFLSQDIIFYPLEDDGTLERAELRAIRTIREMDYRTERTILLRDLKFCLKIDLKIILLNSK